MKKIQLAIPVLLLSLVSFAQMENKMASTATFGRYGTDCSSGRGTCSFTSSKTMNPSESQISRKISENSFLLEIRRNTLTQAEEIKIAGKPFNQIKPGETVLFIQQQQLKIDIESLQNLGIDSKLQTIPAGNYPMTIDKNTVKILFTVS